MATVLVVEPWYGGSHQAWLDGWVRNSRHRIEQVTLPDQFWRWRLRAGAVALAALVEEYVAEHGQPDLVVVSGLVDASSFAGLTRRALAGCPMTLYMHENQLLYPPAPNQRPDIDAGLANWRSLLAVDRVWWNSAFHRDALLDELPAFLARQPEPVDEAPLRRVAETSAVLWPGAATERLIGGPRRENERPIVVWNQRWDHDKNPRAVFTALRALADEGVEFGLALAGENHGHSDDAEWVREHLADRVVHDGWLERDAYLHMLLGADVVVSAADHEFFGIAIVEAIAAGAVPVLPERLSFPELVGPNFADASLYPDGELRVRLGHVLRDLGGARAQIDGLRETMARFDSAATAALHDDAVDDMIGQQTEL